MATTATNGDSEKHLEKEAIDQSGHDRNGYIHDDHHDEEVGIVNKADPLARDLKGRHMQMIAIGMFRLPAFYPPKPLLINISDRRRNRRWSDLR